MALELLESLGRLQKDKSNASAYEVRRSVMQFRSWDRLRVVKVK